MKLLVTFLFFALATLSVNAQSWKDSLDNARSLYKKGEYVSSLEKYKSAQKLAPKEVDLSDEIGQTAYKAQDFKKAQEAYNASSSKQGSKAEKSKVYHNLGNSQLKQKNYKEAIESYKQALRNNPNDEQTRHNLAEAMKKKKSQEDKKEDPKENKKPQDNKDKQDKQDPKDPQNQKSPQNNQNGDPKNEEESKSKLSDKATERMLDDLTKKEIETKKKIGGNRGKKTSKSSGKDW